MSLKANGETQVSLRWLYTQKLRDKYNGPKSYDTIKSYVTNVLKLDFTTGERLT